jgi:hypothetical protein
MLFVICSRRRPYGIIFVLHQCVRVSPDDGHEMVERYNEQEIIKHFLLIMIYINTAYLQLVIELKQNANIK